jgi:hypothetical protein
VRGKKKSSIADWFNHLQEFRCKVTQFALKDALELNFIVNMHISHIAISGSLITCLYARYIVFFLL